MQGNYYTYLYGVPIRLFITGEGELASTEGTTQGDPLAMGMYALAVIPLINSLHHHQLEVPQAWFADDATAAGYAVNTTSTVVEATSLFGPTLWLLF